MTGCVLSALLLDRNRPCGVKPVLWQELATCEFRILAGMATCEFRIWQGWFCVKPVLWRKLATCKCRTLQGLAVSISNLAGSGYVLNRGLAEAGPCMKLRDMGRDWPCLALFLSSRRSYDWVRSLLDWTGNNSGSNLEITWFFRSAGNGNERVRVLQDLTNSGLTLGTRVLPWFLNLDPHGGFMYVAAWRVHVKRNIVSCADRASGFIENIGDRVQFVQLKALK